LQRAQAELSEEELETMWAGRVVGTGTEQTTYIGCV